METITYGSFKGEGLPCSFKGDLSIQSFLRLSLDRIAPSSAKGILLAGHCREDIYCRYAKEGHLVRRNLGHLCHVQAV